MRDSAWRRFCMKKLLCSKKLLHGFWLLLLLFFTIIVTSNPYPWSVTFLLFFVLLLLFFNSRAKLSLAQNYPLMQKWPFVHIWPVPRQNTVLKQKYFACNVLLAWKLNVHEIMLHIFYDKYLHMCFYLVVSAHKLSQWT